MGNLCGGLVSGSCQPCSPSLDCLCFYIVAIAGFRHVMSVLMMDGDPPSLWSIRPVYRIIALAFS
jgi:hypothetical protein